MSKIDFMGHSIDAQSYQDSDMPGYWFPKAVVTAPSGEVLNVALPFLCGGTKNGADTEAVTIAKQRIENNDL